MFDRNYARIYRNNLKYEVFSFYCGNKKPHCKHCGIDNILVLTLDHINSDGAAQRKKATKGKGGYIYYAYLRSSGYQEIDLQVLCHNCHHILEAERRNQLQQKYDLQIPPFRYDKYKDGLKYAHKYSKKSTATHFIKQQLKEDVEQDEIIKHLMKVYKISHRSARRWVAEVKKL